MGSIRTFAYQETSSIFLKQENNSSQITLISTQFNFLVQLDELIRVSKIKESTNCTHESANTNIRSRNSM